MSPEGVWRRALKFFERRRLLENPEKLARITRLMKVLYSDADVHYREADRRERGMDGSIRPVGFRERCAWLRAELDRQGFKGDTIAEAVYAKIEEYATDHPAAYKVAPVELRAYARWIAGFADDYALHINYVKGTAEIIRTKKVGRAPSGALPYLFRDTASLKLSDAELARRLAVEGLVPDGPGTDEPSLAVRWATVIKAARARGRRRKPR